MCDQYEGEGQIVLQEFKEEDHQGDQMVSYSGLVAETAFPMQGGTDTGSIPGQVTKILHGAWPKPRTLKKKKKGNIEYLTWA